MSSLQPVPALSRAAPVAPGVARPGPRLLDQLREQIRYLRCSIRTEDAYVHWVRAFLAWLSQARQVSVSTHRQALSALLFLYQRVFGQALPWLAELDRPQRKPRLPLDALLQAGA